MRAEERKMKFIINLLCEFALEIAIAMGGFIIYLIVDYFFESKKRKKKKAWNNFEKYCFDIIKESGSFVDSELYKPYIKHVVEYNKKNAFDDIDTINIDQTARMLIYNISVDNLLCSGRYHIGHGSLDLMGRQIQSTAIYCVCSSVKKGYISQEEADEILEIMGRNISNLG